MRYRPVWHVLLTGPAGSHAVDGIFDTGTDDTIFEEWVAIALGIDLTNAVKLPQTAPGLIKPFDCRYAPVHIRLTDHRSETFAWEALVGFAAIKPLCMVFGHAGFLQFFDVEFRGADYEVVLNPNNSFSGKRNS